MQVQKIQNNNYNPNFNAKLQLQGCYADIHRKTIESWTKKASKIGKESDVVVIRFGCPKDYKLKYDKDYNYKGVDRSKISRSIIGSVKEKPNRYIKKCSPQPYFYSAPKSESTHSEMTRKSVNSFFNDLKKIFKG